MDNFYNTYINAADLAKEWHCCRRTAQRAIERVERGWKVKKGHTWYAPRALITRRRPGRPSN